MSLDSLNMLNIAPLGTIRTEVRHGKPAAAGEAFDDILAELAEPPGTVPEKAEKMMAMARLSQIQMMQNLFSEDEDEEGDFLPEVTGLAQLSLVQARSGQFIDRYCAHQQPSLLTREPPGRQEIDKLIERVARRVSLEPALIRSVVATESAYRPDAVSPAGARGLMQLMPETARELGVSDSFDAHDNLLGGSRYLKQLLDKYSGDLDHALAAYNWGQGNVDRHGLARMPEETRNYLARVKALLAKESV